METFFHKKNDTNDSSRHVDVTSSDLCVENNLKKKEHEAREFNECEWVWRQLDRKFGDKTEQNKAGEETKKKKN